MPRRSILAIVACVTVGACGGGTANPLDPAAPPNTQSYTGEWSGTTFQQQPVSFTVSAEQKVTAVSVGYVFSGCSGVETLTGLEQAITSSFTQFGANLPDGRGITITIVFPAARIASGGVVFYGPPSCGSTGSGGPLSATRR